MLKFLKGLGLSDDQIKVVTDAYKAKNPDKTELPEYIPKYRFTEKETEIGTLKTTHAADLVKAKADAEAAAETKYADYKDVPKDWKSKLETAETAKVNAEAAKLKAENEARDIASIFAMKPINADTVKAIRALIDPNKKLDEELVRIKESNPHFFEATGTKKKEAGVKGTGKDEGNKDGDDDGKKDGFDMAAIRRSMGLPPITSPA